MLFTNQFQNWFNICSYWAQSSAKARLGVGNKGGRAIVKDARALISRNKQHTTKDARDTIKSKLVNKAGGDLRSILTQKSRANTQSAVNLRRTAGGRITKKTSGVAQRGIGGAGRPLRVQIQQEVGNLLMEDEETQSFSSVAVMKSVNIVLWILAKILATISAYVTITEKQKALSVITLSFKQNTIL